MRNINDLKIACVNIYNLGNIIIGMNKSNNHNKKGQIYLLIGYLGSGKTTFIKNLLKN
jgi:tRNA A37 threonylcarbamoyladenosine biosynthesis protein TsaE